MHERMRRNFYFVATTLLALALMSGAAHAQRAVENAATPRTEPVIDGAVVALPEFAEIPGLEKVTPRRVGKVVILEGEVMREADRALAEKIARAQDGVAEVVNRVALSNRAADRLLPSLKSSAQRLWRLVGAAPLLLVALLVAGVFWWLGGWLAARPLVGNRFEKNPFLRELLKQAVRLAVAVVGLLIALEILDATSLAAALLGSAGVVGIALGFAFRDLLENYIASVLLSVRQPFAPDDLVSIDGHEGVVVGMNSRATILMTHDGNHLRLPNALVFKAVTVNYTRNGERRFDFVIAIEPAAHARESMDAGLEALRQTPGVLADPAAFVQLKAVTREELQLQFFAWVDQRRGNFGQIRSEAIRHVRARLKTMGIIFAPPALRLVRDADADARARVEHETPVHAAPQTRESETAAVQNAVRQTRADMGETDLLRQRGARE